MRGWAALRVLLLGATACGQESPGLQGRYAAEHTESAEPLPQPRPVDRGWSQLFHESSEFLASERERISDGVTDGFGYDLPAGVTVESVRPTPRRGFEICFAGRAGQPSRRAPGACDVRREGLRGGVLLEEPAHGGLPALDGPVATSGCASGTATTGRGPPGTAPSVDRSGSVTRAPARSSRRRHRGATRRPAAGEPEDRGPARWWFFVQHGTDGAWVAHHAYAGTYAAGASGECDRNAPKVTQEARAARDRAPGYRSGLDELGCTSCARGIPARATRAICTRSSASGALPVQDARARCPLGVLADRREIEGVLPAVPEVVLVVGAVADVGEDLVETYLGLGDALIGLRGGELGDEGLGQVVPGTHLAQGEELATSGT